MEGHPGITGLTPSDRAFLQRSRKDAKARAVYGWLLIGVSLFSGPVIAVNRHRLMSVSGLRAIQTSATRTLQAEQDRLKSLQTTTSLEEQLVKTLTEHNGRMEALLKVQLLSAVLIPLALLIGGCFAEGIRLVVDASGCRRYLRIIEVLEQNLRLSRS